MLFIYRRIVLLLLGLFSGLELGAQKASPYYEGGPIIYEDHIYQAGIRSVRLVPRGNDLAMPVIALNSGEQLELSFDDLYEEFTNLSYAIYHCNADWTPSDLMRNDYLSNFSDDYIQDFEFDTKEEAVAEAKRLYDEFVTAGHRPRLVLEGL